MPSTTHGARAPVSKPPLTIAPETHGVAVANGVLVRVAVEEGQQIKNGDLLLIFEAMKMENEVRASHEGTVKQLAIKVGDRVNGGDLLMVID